MSDYMDLEIPLNVAIGVTGHREILNKEVVQRQIRKILEKIDILLKDTTHNCVIISPLAEGADRLVADEVLNWKGSVNFGKSILEVVLPVSKEDYIKDFKTEKSKDEFLDLLKKADTVRIIQNSGSRESSYEKAGHYIVDHCNILIAIWDGNPAIGKGGTGEIVKYAREKAGKTIFWIDPQKGSLKEEDYGNNAIKSLEYHNSFNVEHLSNSKFRKAFNNELKYLKDNIKASNLKTDLYELIPKETLEHFVRANLLAQHYQSYHNLSISAIYLISATAVATVIIQVLFFPEIYRLFWIQAGQVISILLLLVRANTKKGGWQRKWIDYRYLAECLRSSILFSMAGLKCNISGHLPYLSSHKDWTTDVFDYIYDNQLKKQCATIPFEDSRNFMLTAWISDQINFYRKRSKDLMKKQENFSYLIYTLFAITLILAVINALGANIFHFLDQIFISKLIVALVVIFPAVAAALTGIQSEQEYLRNAKRYSYMEFYLRNLRNKIAKINKEENLIPILERANEVMLREHQDWHAIFSITRS